MLVQVKNANFACFSGAAYVQGAPVKITKYHAGTFDHFIIILTRKKNPHFKCQGTNGSKTLSPLVWTSSKGEHG